MTERLGAGLQNLIGGFNSRSRLNEREVDWQQPVTLTGLWVLRATELEGCQSSLSAVHASVWVVTDGVKVPPSARRLNGDGTGLRSQTNGGSSPSVRTRKRTHAGMAQLASALRS